MFNAACYIISVRHLAFYTKNESVKITDSFFFFFISGTSRVRKKAKMLQKRATFHIQQNITSCCYKYELIDYLIKTFLYPSRNNYNLQYKYKYRFI